MTERVANIHHFTFDLKQEKDGFFDDEGDPMNGYYYEILNENGKPLHDIMGPYKTYEEAEEACQNAWSTDSWQL